MADIFHISNYREIINSILLSRQKKGWGQLRLLAQSISVTSTLISQMMKGQKNLTSDQAAGVAQFLNLNELESEYFLALVELERSGTEVLRKQIQNRIERIRSEVRSQEIFKNNQQTRIPEDANNQFYSQWYYSAVRLLTSIPGYNTTEELYRALNIPKSTLLEVLNFLLKYNLIQSNENGKYELGPSITYLPPSSPLTYQHHLNWRIKNLNKISTLESDELMFTATMSLTKKDFETLQKELKEIIKNLKSKIESNNSPEIFTNLNMDLIKYYSI